MLNGSATNDTATELVELNEGRHHDPFALLGIHEVEGKTVVRTLLPFAEKAWLTESGQALDRVPGTDIFAVKETSPGPKPPYQVSWTDIKGTTHTAYDPWTFAPQLTDFDLHLFQEGKHRHAYEFMGAAQITVDHVTGTRFAVWAPNAEKVSVVGDFNLWNGRCHPMRSRGGSGIWEIFIPGVEPGALYKFEIRQQHTGHLLTKTDPYGRYYQKRPDTAAIVSAAPDYQWSDREWMNNRMTRDWLHEPMSVYEVHLGSWRYLDSQGTEHEFANYRDLAKSLAAHVNELGFTHIELLPITEHPFDGSWGYQTTGYFAPTSRFGSIDDFKYFVDYLHQAGIGVLLDWVPGHFPKDGFALAHFDGTPLYEHEDPRLGEHRDWGTLIFNYGRNEVKTFLISSAVFWLKEFHIDGLRVDAVASMLYLDYSREEGDWIPNRYGGNENIEAIEFLRELNHVTHSECSGTLTVAEESTAWPQVTRPTWVGGLGFSMKWNMGWMHDSLLYMSKDPVHRHYHHDNLTFGLLYAFTENFVLPFSHDEVVHGKGSMIYKMPGDEWQRFANLRLLYTYMYTYPGKKLLFMGSEFAQTNEWDHDKKLDWHLLQYDLHAGVQKITTDLNHLYKEHKALYQYDFTDAGFEWIDCHDASQSVLSYLRRSDDEVLVVIMNFTPVPRYGYRIGVPSGGVWREIHNSDSTFYGGSDVGNGAGLVAEPAPWMSRPYSTEVTLPPLGAIVLKPES